MEERQRCRIMGTEYKISGEDSGGQAWWRRCGTTGIDTAAEEMRIVTANSCRYKEGRNALEGRQQTGKILTGNDYQLESVLLIQ